MASIPRLDRRLCLLTGGGLLFSTLLDAPAAIAGAEELAVIVHPSNKVQLSLPEIASVFKTARRYWSGDKRIVPLNLSARSAHRLLFDRVVLGLDADAALRFWIDRKIRGGSGPPRTVESLATLRRVVEKLPGAIGYLRPGHLSNEVRAIRVDGKLPEDAGYPLQYRP